MPRQQHGYEQVSQDLADWIETRSDQMVEAMKEGGRAPFEAPMTAKEKLDFYTEKLFNADGTPNTQGRQSLINTLGVGGYVRVSQVVNAAHGKNAGIGADGSLPEGAKWVAGGDLPQPAQYDLPSGATWIKGGPGQ